MRVHRSALPTAVAVGTALAAVAASSAHAAPDARTHAVQEAKASVLDRPSRAEFATGDALTADRVTVDASGASHVRFARTHDGLPVRGGELLVHLRPDGSTDLVTAAQQQPIDVDTTPTRSAAAAKAAARGVFRGRVTSIDDPKLIVDASGPAAILAYETVVNGTAPDDTPSHLHVLTDAHTGKVVTSWDAVETATGSGQSIYDGTVPVSTSVISGGYSMVDAGRSGYRVCTADANVNCVLMTDADNLWGNGTMSDRASVAVDASYGMAKTYDYYLTQLGRFGIYDNQTTPLSAFVHWGSKYANAFYLDGNIYIGDGRENAHPLASLDIMGHELTHAVTAQTANLEYSGESGGLNEATSDIFGTMIEFYANNANDPGDYTLGEKVDLLGNGQPFRWMYKPSLDGKSPDCYSPTVGSLNVHYSSGLGNKFFYMLAEGSNGAYGTAPTCGAPAVTGVGRTVASRIWWYALSTYMTSTTGYQVAGSNDARAATLAAAAALYGSCSTPYRRVQAAWTATGISGEDAACA